MTALNPWLNIDTSALDGGSPTPVEREWAPQSTDRSQVNATKGQWCRWPYGSFEFLKHFAVER